jgi:hypothetical protein
MIQAAVSFPPGRQAGEGYTAAWNLRLSMAMENSLTYYVLDNAGEATTTETFDGDTVLLSIPTSGSGTGVPQAPSSTLEASTADSDDDQGRVYQSAVTDVGSPSPTPTLG